MHTDANSKSILRNLVFNHFSLWDKINFKTKEMTLEIGFKRFKRVQEVPKGSKMYSRVPKIPKEFKSFQLVPEVSIWFQKLPKSF